LEKKLRLRQGETCIPQYSSHGHLSLDYFLFLLSFEDLLGLEDLLGCDELMLVNVTIFFLLPWICDLAAWASTMALSLNSLINSENRKQQTKKTLNIFFMIENSKEMVQ